MSSLASDIGAHSAVTMESEVCTSSDDSSDGQESLSEGEVEIDGSREMVLVPKKSVSVILDLESSISLCKIIIFCNRLI